MIRQECIDELAAHAGVGGLVAGITARAMNGEIDFPTALRERVALLRGLPVETTGTVLRDRITLMPGGPHAPGHHARGQARTLLVSGGFMSFARPVAERLGFHEARANVLLEEGGLLTGLVAEPILGREAKGPQRLRVRQERGIGVMVCAPPIDALPLLDRLVKEYDVKLAIHNHGPEDKQFPTPYDAYKLVRKLDPRLGLCVDVGHCARGGANPAKAILDCRDRVFDIHLKDINSVAPNGKAIEVGRGVLDIPAILKALRKIKFQGNVGFEYEKDMNDPMLGLAESVGYVRGVLREL